MARGNWLLLAETTTWLLLSRLAVLILPFRWVMRACGIHNKVSPDTIPPAEETIVAKVIWAIEAAQWATPWDSNCLARSITGKRLLRRRGLASTLYLGVSKSDPQTLVAHAWLRCGAQYVTGVPGHEAFTVVATFAEEAIPAAADRRK